MPAEGVLCDGAPVVDDAAVVDGSVAGAAEVDDAVVGGDAVVAAVVTGTAAVVDAVGDVAGVVDVADPPDEHPPSARSATTVMPHPRIVITRCLPAADGPQTARSGARQSTIDW